MTLESLRKNETWQRSKPVEYRVTRREERLCQAHHIQCLLKKRAGLQLPSPAPGWCGTQCVEIRESI